MIYQCIEALTTSDGTRYQIGDIVSEDVYVYLQYTEQEHFTEYENN